LLAVTACKDPVDPLLATVTIEVVDEAGAPVPGAQIASSTVNVKTDSNGRAEVTTRTAGLAIITKAGKLDEPLVFGRKDDGNTLRVKVWNSGARRFAMHSAGDVMFGRRYSAPTEGPAVIDPANPEQGARDVVSAVAPAFSIADVRTVNLETVISQLGMEQAYPGKRFILNSPPGTLAGLEALGVDAVDLANNHGRDFLEQGMEATVAALGMKNVPHFGEAQPEARPAALVVDANGVKVGMLGFTSVDGSFVNDSYPTESDPVPSTSDALWQYEQRMWGYQGVTFTAPMQPRRIGTAWRLFAAAEPTMSRAEAVDAFSSMTAVYPELQDWVERRGHSGAHLWDTAIATAAIADTAAKTDLVVVQLHAGFQFQPAPSLTVRQMARAAIDAGASVVVCHHPHVLQGVEWYKNKLIVYSLGNFIFDQDFSSTFPSMFLRTIWDGNMLLEARLIPLELVGYRPMPVADDTATRVLRRVWEMSVMDAYAERDIDKTVHVFTYTPDGSTQPGQLKIERNTAVIGKAEPVAEDKPMSLAPGQLSAIGTTGLVDPRLGGVPDVEIGRELLSWGSFEDEHADGTDTAGPHWNIDSPSEKPLFSPDAEDGVAFVRLSRSPTSDKILRVRPKARTTLVEHRLHLDKNGMAFPLDPAPRYSIRLRARQTGDGNTSVRLDLYNFYDLDPAEDPQSTKIGRSSLPFTVPADKKWHLVEFDVDPTALVGDNGLRANQLMPYLELSNPNSQLDVDDFEIIEWRAADKMPDRVGAYDYVRNVGAQARSFTVTIVK
jgi:poly-gamma-glutamate capsule biosynthesis protein CapA/YwtB (metallophosphatase superfamily)